MHLVLEDTAVAAAARDEKLVSCRETAIRRAILAVTMPYLRARLRVRRREAVQRNLARSVHAGKHGHRARV